jgi:transposase
MKSVTITKKEPLEKSAKTSESGSTPALAGGTEEQKSPALASKRRNKPSSKQNLSYRLNMAKKLRHDDASRRTKELSLAKEAAVPIKKELKKILTGLRLRLKASLGMFRAIEESEFAETLEMAETFERNFFRCYDGIPEEWATEADRVINDSRQAAIAEYLWTKNLDQLLPKLSKLLIKQNNGEADDLTTLAEVAKVTGDCELRSLLDGPEESPETTASSGSSLYTDESCTKAEMMSFYEMDIYPREQETADKIFNVKVEVGTLRAEVSKCDQEIENIRLHIESLKEVLSGKSLEEVLKILADYDRCAHDKKVLLIERIAAATSVNSNLSSSHEIGKAVQLRELSDKKQGAQPGHKGSSLKRSKNVDEKRHCRFSEGELPKGYRLKPKPAEYQEINIVIKTERISYVTEVGVNPSNKSTVYPSSFPKRLKGLVQYHPDVRAIVETLSVGHFIPIRRISEIMKDMFNIGVSEGTVENIRREYSDKLEAFGYINWIKKKLLASTKIHADETGINVGSILKWLHVASNDNFTYYYLHNSRGIEAIEECNILNLFSGILISDAFGSYDQLKLVIRNLCNAHILRELADVMLREQGHTWANKMKKFLLDVNNYVKLCGGKVEEHMYDRLRKRYLEILDIADRECGPGFVEKLPGTRGRQGKTKERNLIDRLRERHEDYLLFAKVAEAEFTNNIAELDLRMAKIYLRVSSMFRSDRDARDFMLLRGYMATCTKNKVGYTKAIMALNDNKLPDFIDIEPTDEKELMARIKKIKEDKDRLEYNEKIELAEALNKKRERARKKEEEKKNMAIAAAIKAGNLRLDEAA